MEQDQKKKLYKLGLPIMLGTILLIGVSYAWFTLTLNGTKTNVLKAGTLSLTLTDTTSSGINLTGAVPMYDEVGKTQTQYTFVLTNNGTINSGYTIYLDDVALLTGETKLPDTAIKYNLVKDGVSVATKLLSTTGTNPNRILDTGVIAPGDSYTYDLRLWLDQNATISEANKTFRGKIRVVAKQVIQAPPNSNIVAAYAYEENDTATKCITGEERTCQITTEYEPGTIVKYKVNDSETKDFYVLHDDGNTLTMLQSTATTISNWTRWNDEFVTVDGPDGGKLPILTPIPGPIEAIETLEKATASWTNVNDQTYTMGTTVFGNAANAFTGCDAYNSCTTNIYTWAARTAKVRMITLQEAASIGCTRSDKSCPNWMMYAEELFLEGVWTMSNYSPESAWFVSYDGYVDYSSIRDFRAVRAVVVIDK